jgi:hypothetical protein
MTLSRRWFIASSLAAIPTVKLWGWRLPNTKLHAAETAIPAMGGPRLRAV